jgi:hypothetical protein
LGESKKRLTPVMGAPPPSPGGASSATISTGAAVAAKAQTKAATEPTEKCSGSGSAEKCSGSGYVPEGCPLPPLDGIQYEANRSGGWEVWDSPQGSEAPRKTKRYLGYIGKKLMRAWGMLPTDERHTAMLNWIAWKRTQKDTGAVE